MGAESLPDRSNPHSSTLGVCRHVWHTSVMAIVNLSVWATRAKDEYRLAGESAVSAVEHAILCGEALLQAQTRVPAGGWGAWCRENVPEIEFTTVTKFCRLATYRQQIETGEFSTIDQAMGYLRTLAIPPRPTGPKRVPTKLDLDEARKLRKQGMSFVHIGEVFGVSHQHVALYLDPERRKAKKAADRERAKERRAQRDALVAQQRHEAVRRRGGSASEAYALLRRAALAIDKAITETEDASERTKLTAALGFTHKAEDEIVRALRLERTVPERPTHANRRHTA